MRRWSKFRLTTSRIWTILLWKSTSWCSASIAMWSNSTRRTSSTENSWFVTPEKKQIVIDLFSLYSVIVAAIFLCEEIVQFVAFRNLSQTLVNQKNLIAKFPENSWINWALVSAAQFSRIVDVVRPCVFSDVRRVLWWGRGRRDHAGIGAASEGVGDSLHLQAAVWSARVSASEFRDSSWRQSRKCAPDCRRNRQVGSVWPLSIVYSSVSQSINTILSCAQKMTRELANFVYRT